MSSRFLLGNIRRRITLQQRHANYAERATTSVSVVVVVVVVVAVDVEVYCVVVLVRVDSCSGVSCDLSGCGRVGSSRGGHVDVVVVVVVVVVVFEVVIVVVVEVAVEVVIVVAG